MSTLDEDIDLILRQITAGINGAMPAVAEDIKACIKEHIEVEVYSYESEVYPRSGTLVAGVDNADVSIGGGHVIVNYEPDGTRRGTFSELSESVRKKYGKDPDDPLKPNPVKGDDFIARIEIGKSASKNGNGGFGSYDYVTQVGPRPFLTHAVEELIEGKRALKTFISAFNSIAPNGMKAVDAGDQEIFRTSDDFAGF